MRHVALVVAIGLAACTGGLDDGPSDAGFRIRASASASAVGCMQMEAGAGPGTGSGSCSKIDIELISYALTAGGTTTVNVREVMGFTDTMASAGFISGGAPEITLVEGASCPAPACTFSPAVALAPPHVLTLACSGTFMGMKTATLTVLGTDHPMDTDTAFVSCTGSGSGSAPAINLSPTPVAADTPVNTPSAQTLFVQNGGAAPLMFSITLPAGRWTSSSPCLAPGQCMVNPGLITQVIFTFNSAVHTDSEITNITVTSNAPDPSIIHPLQGIARGAVLAITVPDPAMTPFEINFGTIARNQAVMLPLEVHQPDGNVTLDVSATLDPPPGVFSLTNTPLMIDENESAAFGVTCDSPNAGSFTNTVRLTSNAYSTTTPTNVPVRCTVAATDVIVTPNPLDFTEIIRDTAPGAIVVTIRNPGTIGAVITELGLVDAPTALTVDPLASDPLTLGPGLSITTTLNLSDGELIDLSQLNPVPKLRLKADGQVLELPIAGKVVEPAAAVVAPPQLNLGTVCVGTAISGTVTMTNTGGARLKMAMPIMDQSFAPEFLTPTGYPASLLAGSTAMIGIRPSSSVPGLVQGMLTWDVAPEFVPDEPVPGAPFLVPVTIEHIDVGTAVSPRELLFSGLDVGVTSERRTITLENCNTLPVLVTLSGVERVEGSVAAWDLEPDGDQRTLAPRDKMTITVAFTPQAPGLHRANVLLDVDGTAQPVPLDGNGLGVVLDKTSFYACNCSGSGAPSRGWPIVVALALVFRRRRR